MDFIASQEDPWRTAADGKAFFGGRVCKAKLLLDPGVEEDRGLSHNIIFISFS